MNIKNITIKIYDNCDTIKDEWIAFQDISHSFSFQTYEWVSTWYSTIGLDRKSKIQIVKVSLKDEIIMILPLCIERKFGGKILTFSDGDYRCGLFCSNFDTKINSKVFYLIWHAILRKINNYDLIYFSLQPKCIGSFKNPFVKYLKSYPYHAKSYQVDISNGWNEYKLSVSKKLLNDSERQIKRLGKIGDVKFEVANNFNQINIFTKQMIKQKSYQYLITGVKNNFDNRKFEDFYFDLNNLTLDINQVHLSALKVNSEIIAVHWGLIDKKNSTLFYLMPSNDYEKWSKYSPGRILMIFLLKWCGQNSIDFFDMTSGNEKYKKYWANQITDVVNHLDAKTLKGFLLKIFLRTRHFIKYKKYS